MTKNSLSSRTDYRDVITPRRQLGRSDVWRPRRMRERRSVDAVPTTSHQQSLSRQCVWSPSIEPVHSSSLLSFVSLKTTPKHLTNGTSVNPNITFVTAVHLVTVDCSGTYVIVTQFVAIVGQPERLMGSIQCSVTRRYFWFPSISLDFSTANDNNTSDTS